MIRFELKMCLSVISDGTTAPLVMDISLIDLAFIVKVKSMNYNWIRLKMAKWLGRDGY